VKIILRIGSLHPTNNLGDAGSVFKWSLKNTRCAQDRALIWRKTNGPGSGVGSQGQSQW
jgi:hypothetical protein